jgi:hypothetical protein
MASRTVASMLLNWNCERFIVQHIEMLKPHTDKIIMIQATRPWRNYKDEHGLSEVPDISEQIVKNLYPEIEIYHFDPQDDDLTMFHSNSCNFGLSKLEDFDLVTKFDIDYFFTKEDLKTIFNYVRNSNWNNYALDWSYQSVDYYYDLEHGVFDQVEKDPLIVNPKYKFGPLLFYPFKAKMIEEDVMIHHLRNWKPSVTEDFINNKVPSKYGVWAKDLVAKYTPNNEWIKAPEEIRELLNIRKVHKL